jgi:hypothetical protein
MSWLSVLTPCISFIQPAKSVGGHPKGIMKKIFTEGEDGSNPRGGFREVDYCICERLDLGFAALVVLVVEVLCDDTN